MAASASETESLGIATVSDEDGDDMEEDYDLPYEPYCDLSCSHGENGPCVELPPVEQGPYIPLNCPQSLELRSWNGCRPHPRIAKNGRPFFCRTCPLPRSGHRVFCTPNYMYLVGGYNGYIKLNNGQNTLMEVWALNLLSRRWTRCRLSQSLPDTMASFSLTYVPEQSSFFLYGGTGVPFGAKINTKLIRCVINKDFDIEVQYLKIKNEEQAPLIYGQSTAYRIDYRGEPEIYLLGGTKGTVYHMKAHQINFINHQVVEITLHKQEVSEKPHDRYRHESILWKGKIYSIGGAELNVAIRMDQLDVFNLGTKRFEVVTCTPDPENGSPVGRKGHAIVKDGDNVYLMGGCQPAQNSQKEIPLSCIWRLNLNSLQWYKCGYQLPHALYFHSAGITPDRQVVIFGGCYTPMPDPVRTCDVVTFYLQPPRCSTIQAHKILTRLAGSRRGALRCSITQPGNVTLIAYFSAKEYRRLRERFDNEVEDIA